MNCETFIMILKTVSKKKTLKKTLKLFMKEDTED